MSSNLNSFATTEQLSAEALASANPPYYPRATTWNKPLKFPGKKATAAAEQLGLETVGDLLLHLPSARRELKTISTLFAGETASVAVTVQAIKSRPVRRRGMRPIVEAKVADASGSMVVVFFNQPWLERKYSPGTQLVLHGSYDRFKGFRVQSHAETTLTTASDEGLAHYPASEGLTSTQIFALVREHQDAIIDAVEVLPAALRVTEHLPEYSAALHTAHFGDFESARIRFAFDELLLQQLTLLRRRCARHDSQRAIALVAPGSITQRWLAEVLPFSPTSDQKNAMAAIDADLTASQLTPAIQVAAVEWTTAKPMQRLLMGEVGSGKTVVALYSMLRAVESGGQATLMAPTETLAEQHFQTLQRLLPQEMIAVGLLTGSTPAGRRADLLAKLKSGELHLLVGTHALIEDAVEFDRLLVCVIDEQHRFGVNQRRALDAKGVNQDGVALSPHVLHMTATPIPRTLALTAYGDLDVTALRELPAGRRPIKTHVATTDRERARAYERIREELQAGRQAFVVCPLVEESELLQAKAAKEEFTRLSETEFSDYRVVLMHGQMRPREKQEAMRAFADGEGDVLVATSVIEVGIDVPNATVMLVENAERYGISQLHQLRGRIGRGEHESVCILFGPKDSPRLRALAEYSDGFRLAEIDLELRGEGELVGVKQSGLANFRYARLPDDRGLLERAHYHAEAIITNDPELRWPEHVLLSDALVASYGDQAQQPIPA